MIYFILNKISFILELLKDVLEEMCEDYKEISKSWTKEDYWLTFQQVTSINSADIIFNMYEILITECFEFCDGCKIKTLKKNCW